MTKFRIQSLFRGTALLALILLAAPALASDADNASKANSSAVVAASAVKNVSDFELAKFINSLLPEVQMVVKKLSKTEQSKLYIDSQAAIAKALSSQRFNDLVQGKPPAQRAVYKAALSSSVVYYLADAKFNYCNIMLDSEAERAYDEKGVKKLAAAPRQCPAGVSMDKTLIYVNKLLACTIGDPAYTRVLPAEEAADLQQEVAGTKAAFDGGGIGMVLAADSTLKLPLTAKEQAEFDAAHAKYLADPSSQSEVDDCTGKSIPLTAKEKADIDTFWAQGPKKLAFSGIIEHVMKGSPAEKAGIVDGDIIVKVDGKPVNGIAFNEVVAKMLRGPVGSTVKLTLKRDETKEYAITREVILPDNVWSRDLGDGIYSIVVTNFERNNTAFAILDEMQKLGKKARAFAFDVRDNGGGLVDEGVETVSWLIHDGVIFSQRERVPDDPKHPKYIKITWTRVGSKVISETVDDNTHKLLEREVIGFSENDDVTGEPHRQFKDPLPFLGDKPMAVIINGGCASACEIFAGGVGENFIPARPGSSSSTDDKDAPQGAKVIGSQSFGKFIGQSLQDGPAGTNLKATVFRYFTPSGKWLGDAWKTKIGLTPDIIVAQPKDAVAYTASDAQLNATKAYLLSVLNAQKVPTQTH